MRWISIILATCIVLPCAASRGEEVAVAEFEISTTDIGNCLQTPRWWGMQAALPRGPVVVAGGQVHDPSVQPKNERAIDSIEIVNPATCTSAPAGNMTTPRAGAESISLSWGRTLFFGGTASTAIDQFMIRGGRASIVKIGDILTARSGSASIALTNGLVLITGGYDKTPGKRGALKSAEIFDPANRNSTSRPAPDMNFARAGHSITHLGGGRYLIAGGAGDPGAAASAEIYTYHRNGGRFTSLDSGLAVGRKDHRAVKDAKGRVWFIGGTVPDGKSTDTIEYFDPKQNKFVETQPRLRSAREDLAAIYIPGLNVIVVAGGEAKGVTENGVKDPPVDEIEVIDLATMTVSHSILREPIDEPTLTLVKNDGRTTAELVILQGLGNNHQPVKSRRIVISKN